MKLKLIRKELPIKNSSEILTDENWEDVLKSLTEFYKFIASYVLNDRALYYYIFNRNDSMIKPNFLSEKQKKDVFQLIDGVISNPDDYEDYYKPIYDSIEKIDQCKTNSDLKVLFDNLEFDGFDLTKPFENNRTLLKRKLYTDHGQGLFGELLSYSIEEQVFNDSLVVSKVSIITAAGTYTHASDGIFYNSKDDTFIYGEAKFTTDLRKGIKQAIDSINTFNSRINDDASFILRNTRVVKNQLESNLEQLTKEEFLSKKKMVNVFLLHGTEYKDEDIINILNLKIDDIISCLDENVSVRVVVFPIIDKYDLSNEISKELSILCNKI